MRKFARVLWLTVSLLALASSNIILTSAAIASAECAWVLWQTTIDFALPPKGSANPKTGPSRVVAFDTRAQCAARARSDIEKNKVSETATGREVAFVETDAGWFYSSRDKGGGNLFDLILECWPDTVDPRGPKGK